jgi:menaquinone-dependent protoporphyrinogen oxidase
MKVLVVTASKHGATAEIGAAIADELRQQGLEVTLAGVSEQPEVGSYEAIVLGSGVYAGRWMNEARAFVTAHSPALRSRLIWLFSSGPIGDPPKPVSDAVDVPDMLELTGAKAHRTFAGRVDRAELGVGERAILSLVRAPEGDFRDWDDVRAWAREIASALALRT